MIPLPKRVKTQFPNKENIATDERVPIPIETTFFLEDAEQDQTRMNRYYFNFPAEWSTANNGESIVGVRSMWLVAKRRKLKFNLHVFKVPRDFSEDPKYDHDQFEGFPYDKAEWAIEYLTKNGKGDFCELMEITIIDWISTEGDFRGFFDAINDAVKSYIKDKENTIFNQPDDYIVNRDVQSDGYYDSSGFHEKIYREGNTFSMNLCNVYFLIDNYNDDFKEVFNIGVGPGQNRPEAVDHWHKEIVFSNIWDRHSCKVYSSIAEQSLHHYIGNSQIYFNPIKYYKLNSSDQRFWVELYSGRNYNVPIKLPKNESFVIEMQFLPYNKLLYV